MQGVRPTGSTTITLPPECNVSVLKFCNPAEQPKEDAEQKQPKKSVQWSNEVIDNEHLNKKSSKGTKE
jgi:hypothetical protein